MLFAQFYSALGVVDGGFNFTAMANDARIAKETLNILIVILCDFWDVEAIKSGAEVFAFAQDGDPA